MIDEVEVVLCVGMLGNGVMLRDDGTDGRVDGVELVVGLGKVCVDRE